MINLEWTHNLNILTLDDISSVFSSCLCILNVFFNNASYTQSRKLNHPKVNRRNSKLRNVQLVRMEMTLKSYRAQKVSRHCAHILTADTTFAHKYFAISPFHYRSVHIFIKPRYVDKDLQHLRFAILCV